MDRLCQKLSRIVAVCVVSGCLSCGVYGDETINAQITTAKIIDVRTSDQKLIFDGSGSLNVTATIAEEGGDTVVKNNNAIYFNEPGVESPVTGAGKTFTITNGSGADQLISATNKPSAEDEVDYCNAFAIDLTGICGEYGNKFTISLPTAYKPYSFSAEASNIKANGTFATVIGVPQVQSTKVDYVTVDTNGGPAKLKFAAQATGGNQHSGSAVFGTGYANINGNLTHWEIGKIGAYSELSATAEGSRDSYSTIFGAGRADGKISLNGWKIGTIGNNAKLTSQSEYSTIFGAGYLSVVSSKQMQFGNWSIGKIGAGANLESKSTVTDGASSGASSIVGPAYAKSTASNDGSLDFSGLQHGGAEAGVTMTSESTGTGDTYSTVFGAGYADGPVSVKNWQIGTIGCTAVSDDATTLTSKGKYSSVFGAGYAYLKKDSVNQDFSGWKFGSDTENSIGNNVTITSEGEYATIFGAGYANLSKGTAINFSNWSIGDIGANANFTSTSSSSYYSSIFGAGYGYGSACNFSGWRIGNIGDNATFTSTAGGKGVSYSSVFGAGFLDCSGCDFSNWTIGEVGDKANLTSMSSDHDASDSSSSIFGAAGSQFRVIVKNWTAEFQGNAVVASTAYATDSANCHISTFGGAINGGSDNVSDGMRFYFNGESGSTDPVVTIGALKLAGPWEVANGTATATIAGGEDSQNNARAFGIGPNFQINVGRERTLADTKQGNGTLETDSSITSGGQSSSQVTMNILGEIRAAEKNTQGVQTGSVMRIDGGSTVNCFRPVQDLSKIEIINGTMNLMDTTNTSELNDALKHLQANISYSTYNATSKETELYQNNGSKDIELGGNTQQRDDKRTGNVKLTNGGYPINGKLTIGSGQTLAFGVDLDHQENYKGFTLYKTNGVLHVPNTGQPLVLNEGGKLAVHDYDLQGLKGSTGQTLFYVVRADYDANMTHGEGFLDTEYKIVDKDSSDTSDNSNFLLYQITDHNEGSIVSTGNDEYTTWEGVHACWINDEDFGAGIGIYADNVNVKLLATDYTKDFASEELAAIDVDILSDIRDQVINMELCGDGQDPFIMVIGGHGHQDEILGYGYDYDKYGIVIGHDFVKELSNGGNLKFGGLLGYCHANIDFFGNATSRSKHAGKDMYNVGIFGMYKNENSKHMHTRFHVFGGFAYVENEMSRVDDRNNYFNTKFDSNDINVSAEWMKGMVRLCGLEVGPWAGVTYNRIHQKSYHENGGQNAASLDAVDFDMLDTILGLHAEKIFLHKENDKKYLHLVLRAGWKCQPIRSHSHCLARLDDAGIAPFVPVFGYTDKHAGILYGGLKNKISDNISISGGIGSTISHDHWNISGHVALNYYY